MLQVRLHRCVAIGNRIGTEDLIVLNLESVAKTKLHIVSAAIWVQLIYFISVARGFVTNVIPELVPAKLHIFKPLFWPEWWLHPLEKKEKLLAKSR